MNVLNFSKTILLMLRNSEFIPVKCISSISKSIHIDSSVNHNLDERLEGVQSSFYSENNQKRIMPLTTDEFKDLRALRPCQPENPHILKVSILGEPNVGKSTLTNTLVKWKVCSVSKKVHTTRKKAAAILVEKNKQIVFLDTPGYVTLEHTKKHKLEPSFVMDPLRCIRDANLIAVVIDVADKWTNSRINSNILEVLNSVKDKTSILVLNKVDAMKSKDRLLSLVHILTQGIVGGYNIGPKTPVKPKELSKQEIFERTNKHLLGHEEEKVQASAEQLSTEDIGQRRGWPLFSRVFMVSALNNDGVDDLRDYLLSKASPGDWQYHNTIVTDQHPHQIALMAVRENLLNYLPAEIPYRLDLRIKEWSILPSGSPKIDIKITCANSRHKSRVLGPKGEHITVCVGNSRRAIREAFRKDVVLRLTVE